MTHEHKWGDPERAAGSGSDQPTTWFSRCTLNGCGAWMTTTPDIDCIPDPRCPCGLRCHEAGEVPCSEVCWTHHDYVSEEALSGSVITDHPAVTQPAPEASQFGSYAVGAGNKEPADG